MKPFEDLGMTHLVADSSDGSDHMSFIRAGLPGFQFIQEGLEYFTINHHTNMDVYDRVVPEDLMQSSTIAVAWVYHAAMCDDKMPRSKQQIENSRHWYK